MKDIRCENFGALNSTQPTEYGFDECFDTMRRLEHNDDDDDLSHVYWWRRRRLGSRLSNSQFSFSVVSRTLARMKKKKVSSCAHNAYVASRWEIVFETVFK